VRRPTIQDAMQQRQINALEQFTMSNHQQHNWKTSMYNIFILGLARSNFNFFFWGEVKKGRRISN
jgi:hypothetical protein